MAANRTPNRTQNLSHRKEGAGRKIWQRERDEREIKYRERTRVGEWDRGIHVVRGGQEGTHSPGAICSTPPPLLSFCRPPSW
jgi:hypothetical protein